MPIRTAVFAAALVLAGAPLATATAQEAGLSGPPAGGPEDRWAMDGGPGDWRTDGWRSDGWRDGDWRDDGRGDRADAASTDGWRGRHGRHRWRGDEQARVSHAGECWAQVRYPAQFAPPPSGPEYVWTRQPGPPGAPGPIWCLTVQPLPNRPVMVSPERYGWVRVLCDDQATRPRIARLQRGLHARGLYQGEIDGRYDSETASAVRRFQEDAHIEHRGYLSYETEAAIDAPPPFPAPQLTTFDTGYIDWPGKVRY